jgi:hypothetical protein
VLFGAGGEPVRVSGRGLSWWQLRYAHLVAIRSRLLERGLAPASVNLHLVALRRVRKECWRLGHLSGEDYQRAAAVPEVAGSRLPAHSGAASWRARRPNVAGGRAPERSLRVRGKGNRQRLAYVTEDAAVLLNRWLAVHSRAPGSRPPEHCEQRPGGSCCSAGSLSTRSS